MSGQLTLVVVVAVRHEQPVGRRAEESRPPTDGVMRKGMPSRNTFRPVGYAVVIGVLEDQDSTVAAVRSRPRDS